VLLLYGIGFVAGLIVGISPCILPVLPVVLFAGATAPPAPDKERRRSRRAYAVVAGLVISFSVVVLVGSELLSALHLPQDLLRDAGLVVLGVVSAGLVVPALGHLLERPFARLARHQPNGSTSGFVLGLGLGVVFTPCAGPILTAITTVGSTHRVGFAAVVLTVTFALGAAVPLLVIALAGQRVAQRVSAFRRRAPVVRAAGGLVMLLMTLLIAFNVTDSLQRDLPGYTTVLQNHVEGSGYAKAQLHALTTGKAPPTALGSCTPSLPELENCGSAPAFTGVTTWLNTPGDRPLTVAGLRGKVVLVDFWTYSCINCQRSLPHVESWYNRYHSEGFEVVGVHTPEFAFEHVVSNVVQAAKQLGVDYPIAVDNAYGTWNAYSNSGWPAEYLVDSTGLVRHTALGEGDYATTESLIRGLLTSAHPGIRLPAPTHVLDTTPRSALTPESYLGYDRLQNFDGTSISPGKAAAYQFPPQLAPDSLALAGTWTVGAEKMTAGADARLELQFTAHDVYLVLGGAGTVGVSVDGGAASTTTVSGIPRLYTLVHGTSLRTATLVLSATAGIDAYDFTFG
jgi:cytochrome c biogenesis protein CcdA/thiol-disulfide isomerase/thioredoxin